MMLTRCMRDGVMDRLQSYIACAHPLEYVVSFLRRWLLFIKGCCISWGRDERQIYPYQGGVHEVYSFPTLGYPRLRLPGGCGSTGPRASWLLVEASPNI